MFVPQRIKGSADTVHPIKEQIEQAKMTRFSLLEQLQKQHNITPKRANALAHYDAKTTDEKRYRNQALPLIAKFQQIENELNARLHEIRRQLPTIDNIHPVLQPFYDALPLKPYAAESKHEMSIKHKQYAWNKEYIQPNHPAITGYLLRMASMVTHHRMATSVIIMRTS